CKGFIWPLSFLSILRLILEEKIAAKSQCDAPECECQGIGDRHMSTSPGHHRMVPRRLIEFRRGWQASLCQVHLMPGSRGLDSGAWRSLNRTLSDQVDEFDKGMGPVNRNQTHILRSEHEMVMGVFESRQEGQIRDIEDVGTGADQ